VIGAFLFGMLTSQAPEEQLAGEICEKDVVYIMDKVFGFQS
jgi:hypothetical protein